VKAQDEPEPVKVRHCGCAGCAHFIGAFDCGHQDVVKDMAGDYCGNWTPKEPEPVVKENFTAVEQECEICGEVNERLTTRLICDRCYAGEGVKTPPSTVCESRRDQGLIDCKIVGGKGNELWIVDMPWGNSIALYKAVGRKDFAYIETEIGDKFLSMQAFDDPPVRAWFRK